MFVRNAIENLIHEGAIGLVLTGVMILVFLGSMRATVAVFLSIPLSALAAFIALSLGDSTINAMILGGLALAFSRLIDNSVVVLENIFRHLELGETPEVAAERGGQEVALPVLAATLTTAVVFFPVTFLYGVSRFLFTALALAVVLSLFASYFVAMTVVPLFCAQLHQGPTRHGAAAGTPQAGAHASTPVQPPVHRACWTATRARSTRALARPLATVLGITGIFMLSASGLYPLIGKAYFPRTDPGQFVINLKAPDRHAPGADRPDWWARSSRSCARWCRRRICDIIVSNIGITPGFSSIYTPNSGPHTAFVQVGLAEQRTHSAASNTWTACARGCASELPQLGTLLPDRRPGGCRAEPGHARAAGHPGQRQQPATRPTRSATRNRAQGPRAARA